MSEIDYHESNDKNENKYEKMIDDTNKDIDKVGRLYKNIMNAYSNIDSVTNYGNINCNPHRELKTSTQYSTSLQEKDDEYRHIIGLYRKDFIDYKMNLAYNDFFNDNKNDIIDSEDFNKIADKSIKIGKNQLDLQDTKHINKHERKRMKERKSQDRNEIITRYKKNERIGKQAWSYTTMTGTTIDNIERQLIGLHQRLSAMKLEMEKDMDTLQSCILQTTEDIDKVQITNNKLKQKINSITNEAAGGEGKLYDAQLIYNQNYLGNCIILIIVCVVLYKSITHYIVNQEDINNTMKESVSNLSDMVVNSASQVINNNEKIDKDV